MTSIFPKYWIYLFLFAASTAHAEESTAELARKLSNPVSSLISVPFEADYDRGYGPGDGGKYTVNIQPVIPFTLNDDWTVISRSILPVTWQDDVAYHSGQQFGLGDTTQSFFISPRPTDDGIIWGAGPMFLLPTATDDLLGGQKWGAGPTVVVLKQSQSWTYGLLANHLWSFAGDRDRTDISTSFVQPFIDYTTKDAWTFELGSESNYDWQSSEWSIPINFDVSKLVKIGDQPVSIGGGVRYWAASPKDGPDGWGARFVVTFLFTK
ncbi:transporter [Phyllobacterium sp. SYP-B3895]|uniref:transporter n=1 Tax=Phyllobacterium sp. SYP-B3895 TaxID=2663240 RepID=UPI00129971E1|nr:transporter [Phyllobacterium sp. SYP-B3895]MRG55189.1 transporter [Phyllobacterium sp. SYP-B3895]